MEEKEENKVGERSGYYIKRPQLRNRGPSKLRQQFRQGMALFVVVIACILVYFALLRFDDILGMIFKIGNVLRPVIYGLAIAFLLNPIVKFVEKHLIVLFEKKK